MSKGRDLARHKRTAYRYCMDNADVFTTSEDYEHWMNMGDGVHVTKCKGMYYVWSAWDKEE